MPASPEEAALDTVPNPHPGLVYLVRFTCLLGMTTLTAGDDSPVKAIIPDLSKIADEARWKIFHASGEVAQVEGKPAARLIRLGLPA